jgi:ectoine hydroxylase-related dioxygenase (phytanoyl-CoA dioxygenase family)
MYHDQALFKEAGGGPTPWHQDQFYWPLDCPTVTMWMALVDADSGMGTMRFASGSQRDGYLATLAISDESDAYFDDLVRQKGYSVAETGALSAGDATFHTGWTLHSAGPNSTDRMRSAMTVIYYPDGARIIEPDQDSRRHDLERWFPGQEPGEAAASPINPVLWSRNA